MKYFWPDVSHSILHATLFFIFAGWILHTSPSCAQAQRISGRVTDRSTGKAVAFANVVVDRTNRGTTTDMEGYYQLSVSPEADSLHVSFVGYLPQVVSLRSVGSSLDVQLTPDVVNLQEVVFYARENPAFALLRRVQRHRAVNDKRSLPAYDYESYIKTEVALDDVSGEIKNSLIRKAREAVKDTYPEKDSAGYAAIPIIMTETLARAYYRNNPEVRREDITKSSISGIGLSSNSWLSQLTASSLQQFNFYENWVKIIGKEFISPIAASGRTFYEYYLSDSLYLDDAYCYRLDFVPKNQQDLAFEGTAWITKKEAALKKIVASVGPAANINYIARVRIEQALVPTGEGAWLPKKAATRIDSKAFGEYPSLRVRSYVSNRDMQVNDVRSPSFYATNLTVSEDAYKADTSFWQSHRHITLSTTDQQAYDAIDTLNDLPTVRRATKFVDTFASGYYDIGLIELGPIPYTYARNEVEGHRFRLGFKTSPRFSPRWTFRNYLAYGTHDRKVKYGAEVDYILRRSPWTQLSVQHAEDLSQLGWFPESEKEVKFFEAAALFGDLSTGYRYRRSSISLFRQLPMGVGPKIALRRQEFQPLFDFSYPIATEGGTRTIDRFTTTELRLGLHFARDEQFVQRDNRRVSLGGRRWPVFTAEYVLGLKDVLGGNFSYQKVELTASQKLKVGLLGTSQYELVGGYIHSPLPYPLLEVHLGNTSPFYYRQGFNTMNRSEFISDQYVTLRYTHFFEGFFLNRIPLMRRLDWRLLTSTNVLYGGVRDENKAYRIVDGQEVPAFGFLNKHTPFVEIGYGIENIFRVVRVEAYHRLNYLDHPEASQFSVKVGLQFKF